MAEVRMRQFLWAAALAGGLILPALAAPSKAPERTASIAPAGSGSIDVAYDLRYWFIPFGHTTYHGVFTEGTYRASSYFKTSGVVSVFWQAEIDAGASGRVEAHKVSPFIYDSHYRRGSEHKQQVKLTYRADGPPRLFAQPAYNTKKYPVPEAEQEKGVDPMSAITLILSGVMADAKNPCGTVAPVFDGRRRYNIAFTYIKDQQVKLDNGIYNGAAHLCRVHYDQIAGYKPKMLKEGEAWPPIFVLTADVKDASAPEGHYVVPLKAWANTSWGTVTAELTKLKTGGADKG